MKSNNGNNGDLLPLLFIRQYLDLSMRKDELHRYILRE